MGNRPKYLDKLLFISFIINVFYLSIIFFGQLIWMIVDPNSLFYIMVIAQNNLLFKIVNFALFIPIIFLWISNIYFFYKHDRYSRSFIPLILLSIIYSPIYYYQVKIKKRPLINTVDKENEAVIGKSIYLEDYEDESEYDKDIRDI
ncbi:MAG: hypothetical protein GQ527_11420 [Bacteroidales bacterium]|nr:hypothetical protein [Bacteroidales bacterium]